MAAQTESARIERLVGLCKLWGAIKFFHPYLGYREDIDWDAALVTTLPKVNTASEADDYAAAVQDMLHVLHDPATTVVHSELASSTTSNARELQPTHWDTIDGILVISIQQCHDPSDYSHVEEILNAAKQEIPNVHGVVFDLRTTDLLPQDRETLSLAFSLSEIVNKLSTTPVSTSSERFRMHQGFVPQQGATSGGYSSSFRVIQGWRIRPVADAKDTPTIFLINAWSELPPEALALQIAGKAMVIAEGDANDSTMVKTHRILLSDGVIAKLRLSELINADGSGGFQPDITISQPVSLEAPDQALTVAMDRLRDFKPPTIARTPLLSYTASLLENSYSEDTYPSQGYRVLAAFRIWAVINYFFPYKTLIDEDWDDVLRQFIPKLEQAENALAYHLAVTEMITHIHDAHGFVSSPVLSEHFGTARPPIHIRMIENVPVVTSIQDEDIAKSAGLDYGDIVLKIDGDDMLDRIADRAKYTAASTPHSRMEHAAIRSLYGSGDTTMLTVAKPSGVVKEVTLPRKTDYSRHKRNGDIIKRLSDDIGYADLDRLEGSMVDDMFETFKDTKAIIFDMRGYPHGTAWVIAPRLSKQSAIGAALIDLPITTMPDGANGEIATQAMTYTLVQAIPTTDKWHYPGKTVMLIDERAQSQSEHTGLFFEAANGTKFIGSHTAGQMATSPIFTYPVASLSASRGYPSVTLMGDNCSASVLCQISKSNPRSKVFKVAETKCSNGPLHAFNKSSQ